jgi:hypothetical protein|tara:strand:- start:6991 stop:7206 length:216 start_codon:yes stop_codon:yes gene_type:complete
MAKNYSIDYGAKDGPILMDADTGYEVGEAPQEKVVRQLTNLKNFGKDPKNYWWFNITFYNYHYLYYKYSSC